MGIVNIAVCGKFHYANYIRFIEEAGILGNFYFSHKVSTDRSVLRISKSKTHNFFLKEYLGAVHMKIFSGVAYQSWITRYQDLWQWQLLHNWKDADVFHVLNHGAAIRACENARRRGAIVIGEPVNSSPDQMFRLIGEEHDRLGIAFQKERMPDTLLRMQEEENHFNYYLSPSLFVTQSYVKKGVPAEKIFTLPFGVNLRQFRFKNLLKDKFRVIYVAQITPRKGHVDLLEAWKQLNLPTSKAELVFIGRMDPLMEGVLKRYRGIYTYLGTVPHAAVVDYYNSSSVFVMPSVEEGCSYAPLEAMACGLPVILTENTGSSELVTHGKEGFIIPIRSPEKIAAHIEILYRHSEMRAVMGKNALIKSRNGFGWDTYANELISIYRQISPAVKEGSGS